MMIILDNLFMYINESISCYWFERSKYLFVAYTYWSNRINDARWYDTSWCTYGRT